MSNFRSKAFNPASKRVEVAEYCDDYYGRHRYGIRFDDGCVHPEAQCGIDAAATQLDSLLKERDALQARVKELEQERNVQILRALRAEQRVKELEAERDKWDRRVAYDELKAREHENRAAQQRQIDALTIRAEAAEARALRAEQERDDAIAALKPFMPDPAMLDILWGYMDDEATGSHPIKLKHFRTARDLVRRLAGPEKEGK